MTKECTRCEGMPALELPDEPVCNRCLGSGKEPAPCGYGEASCQDVQLRDPSYTCHDHPVPIPCEKCGGNGLLGENGQRIARTSHAPMKACNRCFGSGIEPPEDIRRAPTPGEVIAGAHPEVAAHAERMADPPPDLPHPQRQGQPLAPIVHTNGTSGRELADQLSNAGAALQAAMEALRAAYPNGRDYYIQDTHKAACTEWDARFEKLQGVYREIFQIYENVADQE